MVGVVRQSMTGWPVAKEERMTEQQTQGLGAGDRVAAPGYLSGTYEVQSISPLGSMVFVNAPESPLGYWSVPSYLVQVAR